MVRYLSLAWIDELSARVAADPDLATAADDTALGITQVVTAGPEGDVTYHLAVGDGHVSFGAGPAPDEDLRLVNDWDTAVAVATGTLNAQDAFLSGRITLEGDQSKLLGALEVFAALDGVFAGLRPATRYE